MRSLRTRITVMTVFAVIIAVAAVTLLSVVFIRNNEQRKSDQLLLLLCETGEKNLNYYFNSVQKSVRTVADFTESDLNGLDDENLQTHIERVRKYFDEVACKTNGVLTYYYRIDPEISSVVKGFWYVDLDGEGFVWHEPTNIEEYDTSDTTKLVWFTVPKYQSKPVWLPPYVTDNLDVRVISYNVPIYYRGNFVGVIGIEIDYSTMAEQVDSIRLYENGYAFLNDAKGNLFYHPRIKVEELTAETTPETPEGVISESTFIRYTYKDRITGEETEKVGAWLELKNGMRINVVAPVAETEGDWQSLVLTILIVAVAALASAIIFTMLYTKRITMPIKQLTEAAEQVDKGNYELTLNYNRDDEVGRLTKTFKSLSSHMRDHISDLNKQVFIDALTRVKNKGAFSVIIEEIQEQLDSGKETVQFAVGVFDCDNLKKINDQYGHDKGDIYLKTASSTICSVFHHSPVFRIGGDEFAVVLRYEDYQNRDALLKQFDDAANRINASAANCWDQVQIAIGISVFDPENDHAVLDVVRRADKNMYENKRKRKNIRKPSGEAKED